VNCIRFLWLSYGQPVRRIVQCLTILVMLLGGGVREGHALWHDFRGTHTCCVHPSATHQEHGGQCCLDASPVQDAAPGTQWRFAAGVFSGADFGSLTTPTTPQRQPRGLRREAHPCPARLTLQACARVVPAWPRAGFRRTDAPDRLAKLSVFRI